MMEAIKTKFISGYRSFYDISAGSNICSLLESLNEPIFSFTPFMIASYSRT